MKSVELVEISMAPIKVTKNFVVFASTTTELPTIYLNKSIWKGREPSKTIKVLVYEVTEE